jgi:hypothetical protein
MSSLIQAFLIQLIVSNFSSLSIVFQQFSTGIIVGAVDLCFSLLLLTKASAVEGETK